MVTIDRPRVWLVLFLLTAIMLVHPPSARADRIDINDPTVLGPVLVRVDSGDRRTDASKISEVRFLDGIYSYVYRIQVGWYDAPGDGDPIMLDFSVTGHPLGHTWGAINSSPEFGQTNAVRSITPIYDGFFAILEHPAGESSFTVVYVQSVLRPSPDGLLAFTSRNHETNHETGEIEFFDYHFTHRGIMLVPTPEPGTIGLFALGLAGLAAKRRASRHRRVDQPR